MCGITGFIRSCSRDADRGTLKRMGETIIHRGPDAGGEYLDDWVGLGHRRLSIIDLSPLGNQPMYSGDGRYLLVFNGEIYNFQELRDDLEKGGYSFKSRTDSEVILALYQQDGTQCLQKLNGMFAFAVWDRDDKVLFLARDRIGKKPLYWSLRNGQLIFGSEIKALLAHPAVGRDLDLHSLARYLTHE